MAQHAQSTQAGDHGDKVFVFTETITPHDGRAEEVLALSRKSLESLKGQPGVLQCMLTKSEKKDGEIVTITVWKSKSDFQAFLKTEEFAALLKSDDMENLKAWMRDYSMLMSDYVDGWHG